MKIEAVRKSIMVAASPEHTFDVFREGSWWPKEHTLLASGSPRRELVIEPKVGGRWYEIGEDESQCSWGKVLAWEPPRRILLGWQINGRFEADASGTSEVEINFVPEGEKTRVELEHRGFEAHGDTGQDLRDAVGSDSGWSGLLQKLGDKAAAKTAPARRYFVCKLITPRPDFMEGMSEAEGAALGGHVAYWTGLVEKKKALLFGPVGDPAGVWGLGIVAAADAAEVEILAKDDPAITSGLGFGYQVLPMLRTVLAPELKAAAKA
jgi:uncharacterized protein YndB with AHSA1/START domain